MNANGILSLLIVFSAISQSLLMDLGIALLMLCMLFQILKLNTTSDHLKKVNSVATIFCSLLALIIFVCLLYDHFTNTSGTVTTTFSDKVGDTIKKSNQVQKSGINSLPKVEILPKNTESQTTVGTNLSTIGVVNSSQPAKKSPLPIAAKKARMARAIPRLSSMTEADVLALRGTEELKTGIRLGRNRPVPFPPPQASEEAINIANRWAEDERYSYLSRNPGYVQLWLNYIREVEPIDPVVYFCNIGLDSPAAERDLTIEVDDSEVTNKETGKPYGNAISFTFKGENFSAFIHPIANGKWKAKLLVPCYAEKNVGPISLINQGQFVPERKEGWSYNTIRKEP